MRVLVIAVLACAGCNELFGLDAVDKPIDAAIDTPVFDASTFEIGCSDLSREGFPDLVQAPRIAACEGAWQAAGLRGILPTCGRAAGNHGANVLGLGCTSADLCADGWSVCQTRFSVYERAPENSCGALGAAASTFFATAEGGHGASECSDIGTDDADDFFGCGTMGGIVTSETCVPLERLSGNECFDLRVGGWSCPAFNDEVHAVTKSDPLVGGGVLCCRDT